MLAHKAVHEGHVAAEAAAGQKSHFDARVIPSVAYTDPEIAWVGAHRGRGEGKGIKIEKANFPWAASGPRDRQRPRRRLHQAAVRRRRRTVSSAAGSSARHAGDLISEIALAIEMGADAVDIGKTIHPHPTLGESVGMAAEVFEGVCTDLPPPARNRTNDPGRTEAGRRARGASSTSSRTTSSASAPARPPTSSSTSSAKIKDRIKGAVASSVKTRASGCKATASP